MTDLVPRVWQSLRTRAARDVTVTAAGLYTSAGLGFLTAIVTARGLGPTDFGLVAILFTLTELVFTFASVGSGAVTTRYVSAFRANGRLEQARAISKLGYGVDLAAGVAAVFAVALLMPLAISRLPELRGYGWLAVAYAASFPFASLRGTNQAVLSAWSRFRQAAKLEVGERMVVLVLTVVALFSKAKLAGVVVAAGIGPAAIGVIGIVAVSGLLQDDKRWGWLRTPLSVLGPERRSSLSAYAWTYLGTTFKGALAGVPVLLLGAVRGPVEAGYLKLGMTVFNVSSYLEMSLARVTYPVLSSRWGSGGDRTMLSLVRTWTLKAGLPAAAAILVLIPLVPLGVPAVFGPSYAGMNAGLQVLLLGAASGAAAFWLNNVYYVIGRVSFWTLSLGILTAGSLAITWAVSGPAGYLGASWTLSALRMLFNAVMVALFWRCTHFEDR